MRKIITGILFLFSAAHSFAAGDTTVYNLQQCIDAALKYNAAVAQAGFREETGAALRMQSRGALLPSLNAYANQGINQGKSINPYTNTFINQQIVTGNYGMNASLVLFNGGNNFNTMRAQALSYEADKLNYEQTVLDIRIAVTLAYLQVLSLGEQLEQAEAQMALSKAQLDRLATLEKNNAVSPTLLYDTRGQLGNEKINYINTQAAFETAKQALGELMNTTFTDRVKFENVEAEIPAAQNTTETNLAAGYETLPALKAAMYNRRSYSLALLAARGSVLPVVSLSGSLGTNFSDAATTQTLTGTTYSSTADYVVVNNTPVSVFSPQYSYNTTHISFTEQFRNNLGAYAGISVQVPLFNGFAKKATINQAKISDLLAENQQRTAETRSRIALTQARLNVLYAVQRFDVYKQQAADYEASYKIAVSKFEKGAISSLEYLTAKTNSDRAALNRIAAKYDYVLRAKVMGYYLEFK